MCGRFTNRLTWREIVALYRLSVPATPERNLPARCDLIDHLSAGHEWRQLFEEFAPRIVRLSALH
jgi:hypothetical protein